MTVRTQYAVPSALVTVTNPTTSTISMLRPRTTPVEGNTIDHVVRPYHRQEFEDGLAVVELNAVTAVADIAVRAVEVLKWDGSVSRTVLSTSLNAYLGNSALTTDMLKRLMIAEDESGVRVTLFKVSGGSLSNCGAVARFDFGLHNANYGSNQGL